MTPGVRIMKMIRRIILAVLIAMGIGIAVDQAGRLAYSRRWIDIDVSDGQGHGPDRGAEWDGAARGHIRGWAVLSSLACAPVVFAVLKRKRRN
jgi:hypothetical protein